MYIHHFFFQNDEPPLHSHGIQFILIIYCYSAPVTNLNKSNHQDDYADTTSIVSMREARAKRKLKEEVKLLESLLKEADRDIFTLQHKLPSDYLSMIDKLKDAMKHSETLVKKAHCHLRKDTDQVGFQLFSCNKMFTKCIAKGTV